MTCCHCHQDLQCMGLVGVDLIQHLAMTMLNAILMMYTFVSKAMSNKKCVYMKYVHNISIEAYEWYMRTRREQRVPCARAHTRHT